MTDAQFLDRFMLSLCIYREARGESLRGKQLVADVIRNRVADPRWPHSFAGVVTQPRQFSAFNAGDPNVVKFPTADDPMWADCLAVTDAVLSDATPITTANHYHVSGLYPVWADASKIVAEEGHHVFYCL